MSTTTRMPNGVTNAAPWQTMGNAGIPDPTWAHLYSNDFDTYNSAEWTATVVGTGTQALTPYDGGALLLTNTAGATDAINMQLLAAGFKLLPGKRTFFKFAGQLSDIVNSVFYAGLIAQSTTPLTATAAIYLTKAAGSGTLQLVTKLAGVSTVTALPALAAVVAGTPFEVGFEVAENGNVSAFFNPTTGANPISAAAAAAGQAIGAVAKQPVANAGLTQALLTPSFGIVNTTAAARSLTVDYVVAARER